MRPPARITGSQTGGPYLFRNRELEHSDGVAQMRLGLPREGNQPRETFFGTAACGHQPGCCADAARRWWQQRRADFLPREGNQPRETSRYQKRSPRQGMSFFFALPRARCSFQKNLKARFGETTLGLNRDFISNSLYLRSRRNANRLWRSLV